MKKLIIIILGFLLLFFGIYFAIHTYANNQIIKTYAADFKKNHLGDYAKNVSTVTLAVYDTPLFQTYTNLSAQDTKSKVSFLIWVSLYGGEKEYGLVITDDKKQISHQIEVDDHLEANNVQDNQLIEKNKDSIDKIKTVIKREWNIDFD